jgi:hypothetical protein
VTEDKSTDHGAQRVELKAASDGAMVTISGPAGLPFARISPMVPPSPFKRSQ